MRTQGTKARRARQGGSPCTLLFSGRHGFVLELWKAERKTSNVQKKVEPPKSSHICTSVERQNLRLRRNPDE